MSEYEKVEVKQESLNLERVALTAVIGLLSWNVYTTNQMSIKQAVLQSQVAGVKEQITAQNGQYAQRSDLVLLEAKSSSFEARAEAWLQRLSDRVNRLETVLDEKQLPKSP